MRLKLYSIEIVSTKLLTMRFGAQYRKSILVGSIAAETKRFIETICQERQWSVLSLEVQPDHIHLLSAYRLLLQWLMQSKF